MGALIWEDNKSLQDMRIDINGGCGVQDGGRCMEDKKYHYKVTEDGTDVLDQNDEVVVGVQRSRKQWNISRSMGRSWNKVSPFCLEGG